MNALLALLILIAGALQAKPKQPTPEQKKFLMEYIVAGVEAREKMRNAILIADGAVTLGDRERADDLYQKANEHKRTMENNFHHAIVWSQEYYLVFPPKSPGAVAGGPMEGISSRWNPKFFDPEEHQLGLVVESKDKKGNPHYLGGRVDPDAVGAITLDDGQAFIFLNIFKDTIRDGDPGYLAATLYHESIHYADLTSKGWKSAESTELNAHKAVKEQHKIFYPEDKQKYHIDSNDEKIAEFEPIVRAGLGRFPYATPEREQKNKKWKDAFDLFQKQILQEREEVRLKAEQSRQERYLYQIGDIAKRLCDGSGRISQVELNGLPPISDGPAFSQKHCTIAPPSFDGPSCRENIFYSLCWGTDPEKRPEVGPLREEAEGYNSDRFLTMSRNFAKSLCGEANSVTQAELDRLPRIRPEGTFYFSCTGPPNLDAPTCQEDIFWAICHSAGQPQRPNVWDLQDMVWEFRRPKPIPLPPSAPREAPFQLAAVARKACSAPGSVTERDLEPVYAWFPAAVMSFDGIRDAGLFLDACGKQLYDTLVDLSLKWGSGSRINVAWINASAEETRRREQPVYSPPTGGDDGRERPYLGPCGNLGSSCRWRRR